eukprot:TRINITY_DN3523_c2_g1_i2.p1 TRINITY_DN3523_c2_g1~~TRINITY_DN3523_c2_g1_i2.p1  ORF type:complete len:372 (+),score=-48.44 TRINITY_DN3523_c2_g1_i2:24-1139(+)
MENKETMETNRLKTEFPENKTQKISVELLNSKSTDELTGLIKDHATLKKIYATLEKTPLTDLRSEHKLIQRLLRRSAKISEIGNEEHLKTLTDLISNRIRAMETSKSFDPEDYLTSISIALDQNRLDMAQQLATSLKGIAPIDPDNIYHIERAYQSIIDFEKRHPKRNPDSSTYSIIVLIASLRIAQPTQIFAMQPVAPIANLTAKEILQHKLDQLYTTLKTQQLSIVDLQKKEPLQKIGIPLQEIHTLAKTLPEKHMEKQLSRTAAVSLYVLKYLPPTLAGFFLKHVSANLSQEIQKHALLKIAKEYIEEATSFRPYEADPSERDNSSVLSEKSASSSFWSRASLFKTNKSSADTPEPDSDKESSQTLNR